jgi:hypothetical protein
MHCSKLKFTVALNSALLFWRLLVFEFLLNISDAFLYSMFALLVNTVHLLVLLVNASANKTPSLKHTVTYLVARDGIWIGNWIYWTLTNRNYN